MTNRSATSEPGVAKSRIDQWLWFARFVKSRSLAARLCTAGAISLNGATIGKANQAIRVGDLVVLTLRGWQRTVRVQALGVRRGPAPEARLLYEELALVRANELAPDWSPLLGGDDFEPASPEP